MTRARRLTRCAAALAIVGTSGVGAAAAWAGSLSIAPIRVALSASQTTQALTLRNESDSPVVVQAGIVRWSQPQGMDQFDETRDVLVSPAVLSIAANSSQLVRVALRTGVDPAVERTYRLLLQEVPQAATEPGALKVSLRLSLPVFVAPSVAAPEPRLDWSAAWNPDGSVAVTVFNAGTAHLQLTDLSVDFGAGTQPLQDGVNRYVLPGASAQWVLPPADAPPRAAPLRIRGRGNRGEFIASVAPAAP